MFEKKRGTRFLASVMALVMLLSLAPVGALAADEKTPINEECSTVNQPAVGDENQQAVVNEDNITPTQPTDSAEATKPEDDLDVDGNFSADADTSK